MATDDALYEWAPTVAGIAQPLRVVSASANMSTSRSVLTWRKMTVAVCLVVALRTIDLRCADMTEKLKDDLQENGATLVRFAPAVTLARELQTDRA